MGKNFYAVKVGRVPGIYTLWDECKKQVIGYPGAKYKGFETENEAKLFMGIGQEEMDFGCEAIAYTDGSFDSKTKRFSLGAVLFKSGREIEFSECFDDEELATMRNVAGEIMGATRVMQYCVSNSIKSVEIFYDYEGVEKWCTGEWKTNKDGTIAYKKYYDSICNQLFVKFTKVKGHSGNTNNDRADFLAKSALGIE